MHKDDRVQMQLFTDNETADVSGAQTTSKQINMNLEKLKIQTVKLSLIHATH